MTDVLRVTNVFNDISIYDKSLFLSERGTYVLNDISIPLVLCGAQPTSADGTRASMKSVHADTFTERARERESVREREREREVYVRAHTNTERGRARGGE